MGQYSKKGLYAGYDKNNKEREALDYYATPPSEVENILTQLRLPGQVSNLLILEPSCGGGHMMEGIVNYFPMAEKRGTDIQERENPFLESHQANFTEYHYGKEYDFLSDDYPYESADLVIMNPPFKVATPFILHGLDIAQEMLIVFGRTKLVESKGRYEEIFENYPPTAIYQYIDRVACGKNGDFENTNGIEAHAWFIWDKHKMEKPYVTEFHWLWSAKEGIKVPQE
jgi:predicted RNA methylase